MPSTRILTKKSVKDCDWRGYQIAAWTITAILGILAIYAGIAQGWQNGLVLGGFAVATAIFLATDRIAPAVFNAMVCVSIAMNAGGWSWNLFNSVWGYDEVAHALGTFGMTVIIAWYGYRPINRNLRDHPWVMTLVVVAMGIALGALWEICEWVGYWFLAQPSVQGLNDKISDLVADSIGALIGAAFYRWALLQREVE